MALDFHAQHPSWHRAAPAAREQHLVAQAEPEHRHNIRALTLVGLQPVLEVVAQEQGQGVLAIPQAPAHRKAQAEATEALLPEVQMLVAVVASKLAEVLG